ncbi:MAG: hypothetical protein ACRD59_00425 [Candidatus Acidiferrales bacterium]
MDEITQPPIPDPLKVGRKVLAAQNRSSLETGIYMGGLLIVVMVAALFIANRVPGTERYALERNAAFVAVFFIVMLIPIARYYNRPVPMFASAMIGWVSFVIAYDIAGMFYQNLFQVLRRPLEALFEGAIVYGVAAVGAWVIGMVLQARHAPIAPRRRRTDHLHQQP